MISGKVALGYYLAFMVVTAVAVSVVAAVGISAAEYPVSADNDSVAADFVAGIAVEDKAAAVIDGLITGFENAILT